MDGHGQEYLLRSQNLFCGSCQGINYGGGDGKSREIKLRLRRVEDEKSFYDFEDLVLVMLHELAHSVWGPHNQAFYKLLDEITVVCSLPPEWLVKLPLPAGADVSKECHGFPALQLYSLLISTNFFVNS